MRLEGHDPTDPVCLIRLPWLHALTISLIRANVRFNINIILDTYNLSYNNQEINNIPLESMIKIIENINYFQDISNALITLSNRYGSEYIKTLPVHTLLHLVNYVVANDKAVKAINYWNSIAYAYQ